MLSFLSCLALCLDSLMLSALSLMLGSLPHAKLSLVLSSLSSLAPFTGGYMVVGMELEYRDRYTCGAQAGSVQLQPRGDRSGSYYLSPHRCVAQLHSACPAMLHATGALLRSLVKK